jgi:hypothetical protein
VTDSDRAAFRELREAIDGVLFALRGMPTIPESVCLERHFGESADEQVRLFRAALKRWRKTYER